MLLYTPSPPAAPFNDVRCRVSFGGRTDCWYNYDLPRLLQRSYPTDTFPGVNEGGCSCDEE